MNTDELIRWHRSEASALRHAAEAGTARTTPEPTLSGLLGRARLHDYFAELVTHLAARSHRPAGSDDSRGGWISVEERLPPKNTEVLIAFKAVTIPATGQYTGSPHDRDGWCYPAENSPTFQGDDPDDWTVTHWMPLPDTPFEIALAARAAPLPEPPASRSEG